MPVITQICTVVQALILLAVFPLEAFFVHRPAVQRFLGIEPDGIEHVRLWSFCIGARNALAAAGGLVGLAIVHLGDVSVGTVVVVVSLIYMLLSSLAMALADLLGLWRPRGGSLRGTVFSSVLPTVGLVALTV